MPDRIQLVAVCGSLALVFVIVDAIRRRRLREQYALLWLLAGTAVLIMSLWRDLLHLFSGLIGVYYPPSALMLLGAGFVVMILISFSIIVSDLNAKVTRLAQELSLLEARVGGAPDPESGTEAGSSHSSNDLSPDLLGTRGRATN